LDGAQVTAYERNGFLVLPDRMSELVPDLLAETANLKNTLAQAEEIYSEPDSDELRTLFSPHTFSTLMDRVSRDPRILEPVRQLLGSEVYIMQSRINVKPGLAGKSFPWHSDFETWHVEDGMPRMRAVTAWIMLTENHPGNGPLYVLQGSHQRYVSCAGTTGADNYKTSLKHQTLGVPRRETMKELMAEYPLKGLYGSPGTLVFHECNLLHGSPDNISGDSRAVVMFVFNSVENRPLAPFGGIKPRPHYLNSPDTRPVAPLTRPLAATAN
jgi:ectoine hydroxylase